MDDLMIEWREIRVTRMKRLLEEGERYSSRFINHIAYA